MQATPIDWTPFLKRTPAPIDPSFLARLVQRKRILVTGAGGSIGSALTFALAAFSPDHLTLLDHSEQGLFDLGAQLDSPNHTLIVGDICDSALLEEIFARHSPEIVFHCAACKHVPLMESNPFTAARTNVLGTASLLEAATNACAEQLILLSTDKAVDPISIMGATKRIAEQMVLATSPNHPTRFRAVRLPNVLGTSGSVVPAFLRQIAAGGPIILNDPDATRFFITLEEVVSLLIAALDIEPAPALLVPNPGPPHRIADLADFLLQSKDATQIKIRTTAPRPGDKPSEQMLSRHESASPTTLPALYRVDSSNTPHDLDPILSQIAEALERRSLPDLLQAITTAVPTYKPSHLLQPAGTLA